MENSITPHQVNRAIQVIENHHIQQDYQKLDEILPLAITLLKYKAKDIAAEESNHKYYIPSWVDMLLSRLANSDERLNDIDYAIFLSHAINLSVNDFKPANSTLMGYKVKYMTAQEVDELVVSIKTYFKLI